MPLRRRGTRASCSVNDRIVTRSTITAYGIKRRKGACSGPAGPEGAASATLTIAVPLVRRTPVWELASSGAAERLGHRDVVGLTDEVLLPGRDRVRRLAALPQGFAETHQQPAVA